MGNGPSLQTPNGQSAVNPDTVAAGTAQTPAAAPAPAPQAVPTVELMLPPTPALGPSAFSPGLRKYRDMVQLQRDAALIRSETAKAFTELCADELKALAETTGSLAEFNQAAEKLKQTFLERLAQQRPELAEKLKNLQEEPDLLKHVSLRNNSLLDDAITPQLTTALVQKLYAAVHAAKTECDPHQRYGALHDLLLAPEDSTQFAAQKALALTHTSPTVIEET
ncbi:MAG TPA: hypothetical protein PLP17_08205, partial [Oligoflexia bacterium]|nr:hypothetical protein [Oligoflexia bacterium]